MTRVDTWMPIYWGDYAKDTGHLGAVHHGAYLMLIKHYWTQGGPLPADDSQLWRIACADSLAHWRKIKAVILAFFEESEGRLHHKRIDEEMAKAEGNADRRAESAKRAAEARWEQERARGNAPRTPQRNAPRKPDALRGECPPPSPSNNPHGDTIVDAGSASASPDGPPRPRLPDSAKWAERLGAFKPWVGERPWKSEWGPPPDTNGTPNPLIPKQMLAEWRARYQAAMKEPKT